LKLKSSDIALITGGELKGDPDLIATNIIIDSRHQNPGEDPAFLAIRGINHDGHNFIPVMYDKGVRIFIVDKLPDDIERFSASAFIITPDTVSALQLIASYVRRSFSSPVIAVTGSTGKTIVKEWLADVIGLTVPLVRSPRSFNSQTGVPLSVLKLDKKYRMAIIEAGISRMHEMDNLREVIDPSIGVITNIGDAHSENFPDKFVKTKEKLKLFRDASMIIYCRDYKIIHEAIIDEAGFQSKILVDWSLNDPDAAIRVSLITGRDRSTDIEMNYKGNKYSFMIPFVDRASVENAVTVASVCLALQIDREVIREGLASLVSVAMRMEVKSGINNCQLIEDYYNSDPGSLRMALEYLTTRNSRKSTLILSDFMQTGRDKEDLYSEVAAMVRETGIGKFIGIGPELSECRSFFEKNSEFYYSTDEFILRFNSADYKDETILLKGARRYEFEKISRLLELQLHQTVLEINLGAIAHNLNEFRRLLQPGTRIMVMVKAFAYGAGPAEIAGLLEYHRISYLGVAYADEGVELRNAGVTMPVMVMNHDPYSCDLIIRYNLEPVIYSYPSLERFSAVAAKHGLVQYPVHIKIDTGMHRLGFMPEEIPKLTEKLKKLEQLNVASVFSHLASSEDERFDTFTHKQADIFKEAVTYLRKELGYNFLRHLCNSSGIVRFPQYHFDMVRPGIGIYGIGHLPGLDLKPVGRFKTRISQIKKIGSGEPVGYGCADVSDKERTIAILPVGYADGLKRILGNGKGHLFIRNTKVPITGNICMDMCMVDITGLGAVSGDEAEIFGDNIDIGEIAGLCETIPYEILTSIPRRVRRIFYHE